MTPACLCRAPSSATPTWSGSTRARAPAGSSPPGRTAPTSTSGIPTRRTRAASRRDPPRNGGGRRQRPHASDADHLADGIRDDRPLGVGEGECRRGSCSEADSGHSARALPGDGFSVYDISADCKNPGLLKSDVHLPGSFGHSGQWAPDGKTFYITPLRATPEHRRRQRRRPCCSIRHPGRHLHLQPPGRRHSRSSGPASFDPARPGVQQGRQHRLHHDVRHRGREPTALRCWTSATSSSAGPTRSLPGRRQAHLG